MRIKPMDIPNTRREFERRCHITQEAIKSRKAVFSEQNSMTIESLTKIKSLPNTRIDLLTIDESARLYMNMMAVMDDNFLKDLIKNEELD